MKKSALFVALLTLLSAIAIPLLGQLTQYGSKRGKAPNGWPKFDWPEKKAVLFGHYAPTAEELDLIAKAVPKTAATKPAKTRRILLFYKCDYPHSSIATGCAAFQKMAETTGAYTVDLSDDPTHFEAAHLAQYDAVLLNNTVNFETFLSESQKQSLLDFVAGGKGLIGIHAASDSCKKWKEGAEMIGGIFRCHPWNARGTWATKLESPEHVLNRAWKNTAPWVRDEIYLYRDHTFSRERSRVLMSLDMTKQRNFDGQHLAKNQRHLISEKGDYPIAWLHEYGKGRVFYSNLGHANWTYWNPTILQHYLDGIQYALGDLPADATPSAKIATADLTITPAKAKRIVFLAGKPSHRSGDHEFRAGSILLAKRLNEQNQLPIQAEVISDGWPQDDTVLNGADALIIYCDSDSIHRDHYPRLMELNNAGTGLFFMHYGVHPQKPESGQQYYLPTVGGFMETGLSVNPHWVADLQLPSNHPIRRGCEQPIKIFDEWYYHMRFHQNVIPLATAIPQKNKLIRNNLWNKNGPAGFGKPQTLMWGFEKPDGTRGGGFTGGHYHRNWAHNGYRKMVLNTIVWIAGCEVPHGGIQASKVSEDEINANLDPKDNMTRIKLPLKAPMRYHQDIIDARQKRREAAEKKKAAAQQKKTTQQQTWRHLLDQDLTHWDKWLGVPHHTVKVPGLPRQTSPDGKQGTPLGLNHDPLNVFTVVKENGQPVLKVTGEIFGALTTKESFSNYHLSLQFKWGEKKWPPRLQMKRDSGLLLHCVGHHGAFWNVWKRCLECQIQEGDCGDFFALAGSAADIPATFREGSKRALYTPGASLHPVSNSAQRDLDHEKPKGQWNTIEIYTVGNRMIHVVNGKMNMELFNTRQKDWSQGGKEIPLTAGQIQLQSEAAEISYRDIKIRPIKVLPKLN